MYPKQQWRNQAAEAEGNAALPKISGKLKKKRSVFGERLRKVRLKLQRLMQKSKTLHTYIITNGFSILNLCGIL